MTTGHDKKNVILWLFLILVLFHSGNLLETVRETSNETPRPKVQKRFNLYSTLPSDALMTIGQTTGEKKRLITHICRL
jgi:hypothetical protein